MTRSENDVSCTYRLLRRAAGICLSVVLGAACAGTPSNDQADTANTTPDAAERTTQTVPSPTPGLTASPPASPEVEPQSNDRSVSIPAATTAVDESFLAEAAAKVQVVDGAFLIVLVANDGSRVEASVGTDELGRSPFGTDVFRIGSITKVFTALVTLLLVEDGLVDLNGPAADYVSRVPVPDRVTVRDLLGHRSGIFNTTSVEGFIPRLLVDQSHAWSPEEQLALIADRAPVSPPGVSFNYSNSNYVLLGVLIEEVTGLAYHDVVRDRIIDPLGMTSTYLAFFEDGPMPFDPYRNESVTDEGEPYDYTSIASAAWSAGAMVSSATDLHLLFAALFDERIVGRQFVLEMTSGKNYGLGLELGHAADGLIGHEGGIPGYSTFVRHSVDTGTTAFFASTDDGANPTPARRPVLDALASTTPP